MVCSHFLSPPAAVLEMPLFSHPVSVGLRCLCSCYGDRHLQHDSSKDLFFFFFSKSITFQAKLTTPAASGCKLEKTADPLNFSDLSLKQKIKARLGRCPPHMVHRYGSGSPLWVFAPCVIVGLHTVRKLEWPCVKGLAWTIGKHAGKSTDFRERHSSINHRTVQGTAN